MHTDLTQGLIKDHIVKLALPAVIGYFFHTLINITDTFFAGLISTQALAALSLSASVFFMILAIGIGMSEAVTSLVGNALGKKDLKRAQHIALNAIAFGAMLSMFLSFVGIITLPFLINALGDPPYVQETKDYMHLILYGAIFFMGAFFFNALLNSIGDMKSFRNILMFTAVLNIILDYLFITYFEMGVRGVALATIFCEFTTMMYLFYKFKQTKLWCGFGAFNYDAKVIGELLKQGFPPSVNMFMMAFGMYIITYFVAPFGKEAVAAFGIGMRIEQVYLMPIIGLNIAALAIISQNNGAQAYDRIRPTLQLGVRYGWIISTIGLIVFVVFAEVFAGLLTSDALVIEQTALYLRISVLGSYGFVVIFLYIAMLQGITKPLVIMPVSIYRQLIAPIILFSILAYMEVSILWFWIGLTLIIFSSALFLWWYGERQLNEMESRGKKELTN